MKDCFNRDELKQVENILESNMDTAEKERQLTSFLAYRYIKGPAWLCNAILNIRNDLLKLAHEDSTLIDGFLVRVLSGIFSPEYPYPSRVILNECLEMPDFCRIGFFDHEEGYYSDPSIEAIRKLKSVRAAFSYAEQIATISQGKDCHLIHDSSIENAKFSVIVTAYNVADYLPQCLESLLDQTLEDVEIVCVDDGSTDESFNIIMDYAGKYSNIKVLQEKNAGLAYARNRGLETATGEFIHFLDGDDYMLPESYETIYDYMTKKDLDLLFFNGKSFYENEKLKEQYPWYDTAYDSQWGLEKVQSGIEYYRDVVFSGNLFISSCMFAIRRNILVSNQIHFIEGFVHEDNYFTNTCILSSLRVSHIGNRFYQRRVRTDSLTIRPLEFYHCYGYFVNAREFYLFLKGREFNEETLSAATIALTDILNLTFDTYCKIKEDAQRYYFLALPPIDELPFERLIYDKYRICKETWAAIDRVNQAEDLLQHSRNEINDLQDETKRIKGELSNIKGSTTFKVGKFIMAVPCAVKRKLIGE